MLKLKVCPKCHGDLYLREDTFGEYFSCMQCGYLKELENPPSESNPKVGPPAQTGTEGSLVE